MIKPPWLGQVYELYELQVDLLIVVQQDRGAVVPHVVACGCLTVAKR